MREMKEDRVPLFENLLEMGRSTVVRFSMNNLVMPDLIGHIVLSSVVRIVNSLCLGSINSLFLVIAGLTGNLV